MEETRFVSHPIELLVAAVSYFLGWIYVDAFFYGEKLWLVVFTAVFCAGAMVIHRKNLKRGEHWLWLGCLWLMLLCYVFDRCHVWSEILVWLFLHAFAVYWVLSLAGLQVEGRSGSFVVLDGLNALILYPFKHFFTFLRTRVLLWGARQLAPGKKRNYAALGYALGAGAVGFVLLLSALELLTIADANFGAFLSGLLPRWDTGDFGWKLARFLFISLPTGAYLFGLMAGTGREDRTGPDSLASAMTDAVQAMAKVPNRAWTAVTACFVALYLLFFGFQSSYLFGAFSRSLPEGFTVAEYARKGFFELCRCMGLNFVLLWLVCFTGRRSIAQDLTAKVMSTLLLAQSLLLAVTAMSKLLLYIDCFGFTPLRLQSFWGVSVLAAGCVCALVWLWTGKRTACFWVRFTGATLALLHLI